MDALSALRSLWRHRVRSAIGGICNILWIYGTSISHFVAVSVFVFLGVLRLSLRRREAMPSWKSLSVVAVVVIAGGMTFAKWGASAGLSWLVYYTVPALATPDPSSCVQDVSY